MERIFLLGKDVSLEDIESIESPALRSILKEHFIQTTERDDARFTYTEHDQHNKTDHSRFPWCGLASA
jgi:hypothetical protein